MDNRNLEDSTYKVFRSDDDFARMVIRIAAATPVDAILCATETGGLASRVHGLSQEARVIAATTNAQTYDALIKKGLETIMLPIRAIDRHLAAAPLPNAPPQPQSSSRRQTATSGPFLVVPWFCSWIRTYCMI